jgi:hypothetical protein
VPDQLQLPWERLLAALGGYWQWAALTVLAVLAALLARRYLWPSARRKDYLRGLAVDVSEQDDLIVLIHAARQDPAFRAEVMRLLDLDPDKRRKFLDERIQSMLAAGAPRSFIEAVGLMRDEGVVIRMRHLLEQASTRD